MASENPFQRNIQQAINFETIKAALGRSDFDIGQNLKEIEDKTPLFEPISFHLKQYSELFNLSEDALLQTYLQVKGKFLKLDENDIVLKRGDFYYPHLVNEREDGFPFLYLRGNYRLLEECVGVVGSSKASAQGLNYTKNSVISLIKGNIVPLSTIDFGVALTLHLTAIENNSPSIAVLSTSLIDYEKPKLETLQNEIGRRGLLVTAISPAEEIKNWHTVLRNQLVGSLSKAVVVTEESDGKTGVRIALYALQEKKRVIIFKHTLDNRSLLWPRKLGEKEEVFVINKPPQIISKIGRKRKDSPKERDTAKQLSLFDLS